MKVRDYLVTWDWLIGGRYRPAREVITAANAKQAEKVVKNRYIPGETRFPFHVRAKRASACTPAEIDDDKTFFIKEKMYSSLLGVVDVYTCQKCTAHIDADAGNPERCPCCGRVKGA